MACPSAGRPPSSRVQSSKQHSPTGRDAGGSARSTGMHRPLPRRPPSLRHRASSASVAAVPPRPNGGRPPHVHTGVGRPRRGGAHPPPKPSRVGRDVAVREGCERRRRGGPGSCGKEGGAGHGGAAAGDGSGGGCSEGGKRGGAGCGGWVARGGAANDHPRRGWQPRRTRAQPPRRRQQIFKRGRLCAAPPIPVTTVHVAAPSPRVTAPYASLAETQSPRGALWLARPVPYAHGTSSRSNTAIPYSLQRRCSKFCASGHVHNAKEIGLLHT